MKTLIHQRVEQARSGQNPKVILRVPSGWAVMGDVQFLRGYCLLLPDPVVPDLNSMNLKERDVFLRDMTILGDAVTAVTGAIRINYEILGNSEPALHAHVFPRFANESEERKKMPVWFYDWKNAPAFDAERDRELMASIRFEMESRLAALDFEESSKTLLDSAISSNLEMTPEMRIEAHEKARQLMSDLQDAGKRLREAGS